MCSSRSSQLDLSRLCNDKNWVTMFASHGPHWVEIFLCIPNILCLDGIESCSNKKIKGFQREKFLELANSWSDLQSQTKSPTKWRIYTYTWATIIAVHNVSRRTGTGPSIRGSMTMMLTAQRGTSPDTWPMQIQGQWIIYTLQY